MRILLRTLPWLAISLIAFGALLRTRPEPNHPTQTGETIEVPFRMLPSNHMVVETKLNGKGPFRFIFDLGAPITLLTNKAAEESGAVDKKKPKSLLMGTRGEAQIDRLQMGDLVADKVPVIVMDHPALSALSGLFSKPLAGIIGYTFWARYRMTIDYQARKLTFTPVDFEVQNLFKELPNRLSGSKRAQTIMLAPRGLFGFVVVDDPEAKELGGVLVSKVFDDSPAHRAGLRAGDILTTFDGRWTTSRTDAFSAAERTAPGKPIELALIRDGKSLKLTLTPPEGL